MITSLFLILLAAPAASINGATAMGPGQATAPSTAVGMIGGPPAAVQPANGTAPPPGELAAKAAEIEGPTAEKICTALANSGLPCKQEERNSDTISPFKKKQSRSVAETFVTPQAATADAAAELAAIVYQVVVERAKRSGLEVVRRRIENLVCEAQLAETCRLMKQSSIDSLASNPRLILSTLSTDALSLSTSLVPAVEGDETLTKAIEAIVRLAKARLDEKKATFTQGDTWLVLHTVVEGRAGPTSDNAHKAFAIVNACVNLKSAQPTWSCDVPQMLSLAGISGVNALDIGELANLGISAAFLTSDEETPSTSIQRERFRALVSFVFLAAEKLAAANTELIAKIKKARALVLAIVDQDAPRLVQVLVGIVGERLKPPERFNKASALLLAVANYSETFAEKGGGTPEEKFKARKEIVEALIDAATVRTGRQGEWVFSLGVPVGMVAGAQYLRHSDPITAKGQFGKREWMAPQLEVPLSLALQSLPESVGWHFGLLLLDLAQFAAYDPNGARTKVDWDTAITVGGQVAIITGSPSANFLLGIEGRYSPTLFAAEGNNASNNAGAIRLGLFAAFYVPLFDFN